MGLFLSKNGDNLLLLLKTEPDPRHDLKGLGLDHFRPLLFTLYIPACKKLSGGLVPESVKGRYWLRRNSNC